jgi:type IV pilus assembly protein PilW
MTRSHRFRVPQAGFTLVEILVGLTIGLIAIIVMYQVFAVFDGQKRTTTSGSDAQTTGLISLYLLERDARMAGYGLVYNNPVNDTVYEGQMLCNWIRFQDATSAAATVDRLMPVLIEDGAGANGSDRLTVTYAASSFAPAPAILSVPVSQSTDLIVKNAPDSGSGTNAMFAANDLVLVGTPQTVRSTSVDNTCTLLAVSAVAPTGADATLTRALATSAALPTTNASLTKADTTSYSYDAAAGAPSIVVKLGSVAAGQPAFVRSHYAISAGNELQVRNLTTNAAAQSLGDNVIDLQAQYGLVAGTCADNPGSCNAVDAWTDATGTWAAPTAEQIARIKALRVAVVVRSTVREREIATRNCMPFDGTTTVPSATTPCRAWPGGPALSFTAIPNWSASDAAFFRYRVYETVVPLRNMLWGNT